MIYITTAPAKYSPANNPIFLSVYSVNNPVYFKIEIKNSITNGVISTSKAFVTPDQPLIGNIDLSNILINYVGTPISTDASFFTSFNSGFLEYYITVTEMITSGGLVVPGESTDSDVYTVFNGLFSDSDFQLYNYLDHYINNFRASKFLTSKPSLININPLTKEYLYFLADSGSTVSKAKIKAYTTTGSTINERNINLGSAKLHRLNVSPKDLENTLDIDFTDVKYFEVWIEDAAGKILTEVKRYKFVNYNCNNELVNILWLSDGGVDSYSFINPQETKKVTRSTIKTNKYKDFSIENNGVINQTEKTYNVNKISEYTLTTPLLTDEEYIYLTDMLASEQVYVILTNGSFYPVKLLTTSSDVKRKRYSTSSLRFELKFEAESNLNLVTK